MHAEMDVLRKLNVRLYRKNKMTLDIYVIRLTKAGDLAESKPCKHCIQLLLESGLSIKYVYYSTSEKKIVRTTLYKLYMENNQYVSKGQR
jgi:deoxycytidylate deaminase